MRERRRGRRSRLLRSMLALPTITSDPVRQLQFSILLLVMVLMVGTGGYVLLEGMVWVDALYMTVITLTTVGFGEVRPLSPEGRLFTIALILSGVGIVTYAARNVLEISLGNRLWLTLGERQMKRRIDELSDHHIVCGYGRMGREIVNEFIRHRQPFVIVDNDPELVEELVDASRPHIVGDATLDETLLAAGIERAAGLLAVVDSDADNVLTVLSARGLNPAIKLVARAATGEMAHKLKRAGADLVTSPYEIGGQRMAFALMRPAVYKFLNEVVYSEVLHIEMGQLEIRESSRLLGRTLRECELRQRWGAIVVAIVDREGKVVISPDPHRKLELGDTLIFVAPTENTLRLEEGEVTA